MKWNEYSIISASDQLPLSVLCCEPDEEVRGIVQLVHGMAEHKERYKDIMEFLAKKAIYVSFMIIEGMVKVYVIKRI